MRTAFVAQTVRQLAELANLVETLGDGSADAVIPEVERIGSTASTFGLTGLAAAAAEVAQALRARASREALAPLAAAIREAGGSSRFPPIVIIAKEPLLGRLSVEAARCCERLVFHETVASWHAELSCHRPEAIVLPLDELDALTGEDRASSVFVYAGSGYAMDSRLQAVAARVQGLLPERVEFRPLLDRIRAFGHVRRAGPPRVLLAVEDRAFADGLSQQLGEGEVVVASARRPEEVGTLLREASPDLVVVSEALGGLSAAELVAMARMVPRQADLLFVALGSEQVATALLASGFDGVIDTDLPLSDVVARTMAYLERARSRPTGRDATTGLPDRGVLLRSLDRGLSDARRGGRPLSVALVEIDGGSELARRGGRGTRDTALRLLARCVEGALRASDVVGRLDEDAFLVILPSCGAEHARRRLGDVRSLFTALCARDERLAGLTFSAGVADTGDGTDGLLARAEDALERGRGDARGGIT